MGACLSAPEGAPAPAAVAPATRREGSCERSVQSQPTDKQRLALASTPSQGSLGIGDNGAAGTDLEPRRDQNLVAAHTLDLLTEVSTAM